jgi:hypothetical protein
MRQQLDPCDGDGLVIAAAIGILATNGDVVSLHTQAHLVDGRRLAERMHVTSPGEQVSAVGPLRLGQCTRLEGGEKLVDLPFGDWQHDGGLLHRIC